MRYLWDKQAIPLTQNHVKSKNSTQNESAIDDQQQYSAVRNASAHTWRIETDYRL